MKLWIKILIALGLGIVTGLTMGESASVLKPLGTVFLNLINMYEHSDGGAAEFGGALLGLATDPSTYFGLGVGGLAAKGVAKTAANISFTWDISFFKKRFPK